MSHRNDTKYKQAWYSQYEQKYGIPVCRLAEHALSVSHVPQHLRQPLKPMSHCIRDPEALWPFTENVTELSKLKKATDIKEKYRSSSATYLFTDN